MITLSRLAITNDAVPHRVPPAEAARVPEDTRRRGGGWVCPIGARRRRRIVTGISRAETPAWPVHTVGRNGSGSAELLTLMKRFLPLWLGLSLGCLVARPALAQPANDTFANAVVIPTGSFSYAVSGTNANANTALQTGETTTYDSVRVRGTLWWQGAGHCVGARERVCRAL